MCAVAAVVIRILRQWPRWRRGAPTSRNGLATIRDGARDVLSRVYCGIEYSSVQANSRRYCFAAYAQQLLFLLLFILLLPARWAVFIVGVFAVVVGITSTTATTTTTTTTTVNGDNRERRDEVCPVR